MDPGPVEPPEPTRGERARVTRWGALGAWYAPAALVAAGVITIAVFDRALVGGLMLPAAFFLAALLRLLLPAPYAGGLVVRGRWQDVVTLTALGSVILLAIVSVTLRATD